ARLLRAEGLRRSHLAAGHPPLRHLLPAEGGEGVRREGPQAGRRTGEVGRGKCAVRTQVSGDPEEYGSLKDEAGVCRPRVISALNTPDPRQWRARREHASGTLQAWLPKSPTEIDNAFAPGQNGCRRGTD